MNRFNGLPASQDTQAIGSEILALQMTGETVETGPLILTVFITGLKPGVNESKALRLMKVKQSQR